MWTEILDSIGIEKLMELYGGFHDSCLRDVYISTSDFVDEKRAMHFGNTVKACLLFQRQSKANSVLELRFDGVEHLNFQPTAKNYNGVIYDATLKLENGMFYWADFEDWSLAEYQAGDKDSIWVNGKRLFYQFKPELIGNIYRLTD